MLERDEIIDLDAIRERAERARETWAIGRGKFNTETDGRYIESLLDVTPALIAEVERLRAATVKPDREAAARAFWNGYEHSETEREGFDAGIEAVRSLLPGRTEGEVKAEALGEVRTKIEGAMTALDAYTDEHAETARTALRGCLRVVDRLAAEGGAS